MWTLKRFLSRFPSYKTRYNGEIASPCPFCEGQGEFFHGTNFVGDDRLVWFSPPSILYCRRCGPHSYEELAFVLFGENAVIDPELLTPVANHARKELVLVNDDYVDALHRQVDYAYWRSFSWDDDKINRFRLGYGLLYPGSKRAERHIIPFALTDTTDGAVLSGYALEGRLPKESAAKEPKNIKTAGVTRQYVWGHFEGGDELVITEGIKDGISAVGTFSNVVSFFGATTDLTSLALYVNKLSFKRVIIAADNDAAGRRYTETLSKNLAAESVLTLLFPDQAPAGCDLTDLLAGGATLRYSQLDREKVRGFFPDYRVYDRDYLPAEYPPVNLSEVRQHLETTLADYLENYRSKYFNTFKLLAAPPGAGKSFALVRAAEKIAQESQRRFLEKKTALEAEYLQNPTRAVKDKLDRLHQGAVVYAGPFINGWSDIQQHWTSPDLWYNFQARNPTNCKNYQRVTAYADRGYNAAEFCRSVCPFFHSCKQTGYLSQEEELKKHPIVYIRHQNLVQKNLIDPYKVVIIDENFLNVFDEPLVISPSDLQPAADIWTAYVSAEQAQLMTRFINALKLCFVDGLRGLSFYRQLDAHLDGALESVLMGLSVDTLRAYQPEILLNEDAVLNAPLKCVEKLVHVFTQELDSYKTNVEFNSRVSVTGQKLLLYFSALFHVSRNKPMIISDGTANAELYELITQRKSSLYSPKFVNPESKTIVYWGSDFTRSYIRSQVGGMIKDFENWLDDQKQKVFDVYDQEYDLTSLPVSDDFYQASSIQRAFYLLVSCAQKHSSLFVVCYKNIQPLLQKRLYDLYPDLSEKVGWGHYGSLRGTNRYSHFDAALLIGCPRVSYQELYSKIAAYAALAGKEYIAYDLALVPIPYDGRLEGAVTPGFVNPFAQAMVDMVETGEVRQALERIRLHTSNTPKTAYVAMTRPTAQAVTELHALSKVLFSYEKGKYAEVYAYIQAYNAQHKRLPSYSDLQKRFKISSKTVSKIVKGFTP